MAELEANQSHPDHDHLSGLLNEKGLGQYKDWVDSSVWMDCVRIHRHKGPYSRLYFSLSRRDCT